MARLASLPGLWLMSNSDCQKHFQLKYAPGKLITEGFFRYVRNPNYLGDVIPKHGSNAGVVKVKRGGVTDYKGRLSDALLSRLGNPF